MESQEAFQVAGGIAPDTVECSRDLAGIEVHRRSAPPELESRRFHDMSDRDRRDRLPSREPLQAHPPLRRDREQEFVVPVRSAEEDPRRQLLSIRHLQSLLVEEAPDGRIEDGPDPIRPENVAERWDEPVARVHAGAGQAPECSAFPQSRERTKGFVAGIARTGEEASEGHACAESRRAGRVEQVTGPGADAGQGTIGREPETGAPDAQVRGAVRVAAQHGKSVRARRVANACSQGLEEPLRHPFRDRQVQQESDGLGTGRREIAGADGHGHPADLGRACVQPRLDLFADGVRRHRQVRTGRVRVVRPTRGGPHVSGTPGVCGVDRSVDPSPAVALRRSVSEISDPQQLGVGLPGAVELERGPGPAPEKELDQLPLIPEARRRGAP